jgi:hypothetical protein
VLAVKANTKVVEILDVSINAPLMKELVKTILVIILFLPFYHSLLFNDNLQNHVRKPYIIMTKFTGFSKSFASHFKVVFGYLDKKLVFFEILWAVVSK